jgi:ribose transport system ATP-binding protein
VAVHEPAVRLAATGVTKRFPGILALDDARFALREGRVQALVGKNGAGKSTLMGVLAGLVDPDVGAVLVDGQEVEASGPWDLEREGVVLVPQHATLFGELSILDNLLLPDRLPTRAGALIDWAQARRTCLAALAQVGLDLDPDRPAAGMAAGAVRLIMIARALVRQPRVLILDEPTESFTEDEVTRLFALMRRLVAQDMALVYVSHRLEEVLAIADGITVMRDGRNVAEVAPADDTRDELVSLIVGGDDAATGAEPHSRGRPRAAAGALLEVTGLHAAGVRGASLEVRDGEVVGLYGPLGSGRSEILRAVAGLMPRPGGAVRIDGMDLPPADIDAPLARGVVYLPEDRRREAIFHELTVRENVAIAMANAPVARRHRSLPLLSKRREAAAVRPLLDVVRFDRGELEQPVGTLSGGTQQKVVLARALSCDPRLWLLDEPLVGLDIATRREVFRIVRTRIDAGGGALVVLSDYEDLELMCDRVYTMRDGRITGSFAAQHMSEAALMHAMSFGEALNDHGEPGGDTHVHPIA